jgi:GNAT superfamily N-acetyltransferase
MGLREEPMPEPPSVTVRLAELGRDDQTVSRLMSEYLTWALVRLEAEYGIVDMPVEPAAAGASLSAYHPPSGLLAVAELRGQIAGVGAGRMLTPGVAEVKRMYVSPVHQGQHVGAAILDFLLAHARADLGATTVRLDTCRFMTPAQQLYRSRGFTQRSPYEGTEIPPRLQQYWLFFERSLEAEEGEVAVDPVR